MSEFKPVDFEKEEKEILEKLEGDLKFKTTITEWSIDREKLKIAVDLIRKEIELIGMGASEFIDQAIRTEERSPVNHALKVFEIDPWPKRLEDFLKMARQDFNPRVEKQFKEWTDGIFGEPKEGLETLRKEQKIAKRRPLESTLFGLMHDVLTVGGPPLDQRAAQRLRMASLKLAKAIQAESKMAQIANMKRLQGAIMLTFEAYDRKIKELEDKLNEKNNNNI